MTITKEWFVEWLKAACMRGIRTAAQVGVLLLGSEIFAIQNLDWTYILGCMAGGFVLAILNALTGLPEVPTMEDMADIEIPKGE